MSILRAGSTLQNLILEIHLDFLTEGSTVKPDEVRSNAGICTVERYTDDVGKPILDLYYDAKQRARDLAQAEVVAS